MLSLTSIARTSLRLALFLSDVVPLSYEMVSGIVAKTLQWGAGREPSREDQHRFVEGMFAQLARLDRQ